MMFTHEMAGFEQCDNGDVRVKCMCDGGRNWMTIALIPKSIWCSLIAQMSYYGEEDYGYYRAMDFHSGSPVPVTCPLKDKPAKWQEGA